MKKFVTFLLVLTLILSMSATAFAAGSPTSTGPKTAATGGGLGLYNDADKRIAAVPESKVLKLNVGKADQLDAADKDAFLAAYETAKNTEDRVVRRFFWLDIPDEYKNMDGFSYAKLTFGCRGQNVEVTVNGKPMEVVKLGHGQYYAKITEFGVVSITSD